MNYSVLFKQLLPEAVLVITALVLLGVAVSIEAKCRKSISNRAAIVLSLIHI